MSFYHTWRKRLACERCRHLKVRCEYKSPTSDTCARCEKSHTPCIIPNAKKGGNGQGNDSGDEATTEEQNLENKEQNAAYLQKIIKDAEDKLKQLNVSPLRQALTAELYTLAEVESYYKELRSALCMFPAIRLLKLDTSIMEVDKEWPWLAIAMVTVKAMNTIGKPVADVQYYIRSLHRNDITSHDPKVLLDQQLALALVCQYALSFRNRNLGTLLTLHGMTVTVIRQLERQGDRELAQLAANTATITILPYTFTKEFTSLNPVVSYYRSKMEGQTEQQIGINQHFSMDSQNQCACVENMCNSKTPQGTAATHMVEMALVYNRALGNLSASASFDDISRIMTSAIQTINQAEGEVCMAYHEFAKQNGVEHSMTSALPINEDLKFAPFLSTFLAAKVNLLHKAVVRTVDISSYTECHSLPMLQTLITEAADFCGQLFRAFAHADAQRPFIATSMFYHIPDALLCLQAMRYVAFAGSVDIDVRSDCLLNVVIMKWEELLRASMFVRLHFNLVFAPLDMSSVKIGQLDPKTNSVFGSGSMQHFDIIYFDGSSQSVREKFTITQDKLFEILLETVVERHYEKSASAAAWNEHTTALTLPTVLKLLFQYV